FQPSLELGWELIRRRRRRVAQLNRQRLPDGDLLRRPLRPGRPSPPPTAGFAKAAKGSQWLKFQVTPAVALTGMCAPEFDRRCPKRRKPLWIRRRRSTPKPRVGRASDLPWDRSRDETTTLKALHNRMQSVARSLVPPSALAT